MSAQWDERPEGCTCQSASTRETDGSEFGMCDACDAAASFDPGYAEAFSDLAVTVSPFPRPEDQVYAR